MAIGLDVHTHIPGPPGGPPPSEVDLQFQRYFGASDWPKTPEEFYETYLKLDLKAVIFGQDDERFTGVPYFGNKHIYNVVKKYPDRFIGFGSVDPHKGKAGLIEIERCAKEYGLKGLKFHPAMQRFFANDPEFYPVWELCQKLDLICLFHTGHSGDGSGMPGGNGLKLKYNRPIPYIDDVAADFPYLQIIMAHPSWPWQSEQLSMLVHKANVFMDLSGWSPKYFAPELVQYMQTRVKDKVLFGSDYPAIHPQKWLTAFDMLEIKPEVKPLILKENAKRLFKITDDWLDK